MSEMKRVGEPWEAIGSLVRTHYNGHGGFLVADCHTGTTFTSEQCCAHANLIAAAPDLLEGLKALYKAYVNTLEAGRDRIISLGGTCDPVDRMELDDHALLRARQLIAKAQGRDHD